MSKQKTWTAKAADLKSDWFVVDATDQVLGRLASGVAAILRGMVRSIAGALAEVGRGERPHEWVGEILWARDRRRAPRTAPAGGLTLMEVIY